MFLQQKRDVDKAWPPCYITPQKMERTFDKTTPSIMIKVENLSRQYGAKLALDHLSFTADNGSVLGFIGPNGAGKSTAMRMICGILPPASGSVEISGISMTEQPREAKEKLGYLPENAPLYAGMNVLGFLRYCGTMHGLAGKALQMAVAEAVDHCRLDSVLREELEALSKGFRRRVCLAQAILHHPENLVLDEPTDGLDPEQKREIRSLIDELRRDRAVIVSTHILEEIDAVCDNVLVIRKGKKVFFGTTREFRALDPDDGTLELLFDFLPEGMLEGINGFHLLSSSEAEEGRRIRIRPGNETNRAELIGKLTEKAAENGAKILRCEILSGRLETVFAVLAGGEEKE